MRNPKCIIGELIRIICIYTSPPSILGCRNCEQPNGQAKPPGWFFRWVLLCHGRHLSKKPNKLTHFSSKPPNFSHNITTHAPCISTKSFNYHLMPKFSIGLTILFIAVLVTWVYISVVFESLWPNNYCIYLKSVPCSSKWVAKLCRKVCTLAFLFIPLFFSVGILWQPGIN